MTITVYSKPNCPQCVVTKTKIQKNGHSFDEVILDIGQPKLPGVKYISRDELFTIFPGAKTMPLVTVGENKCYTSQEVDKWL